MRSALRVAIATALAMTVPGCNAPLIDPTDASVAPTDLPPDTHADAAPSDATAAPADTCPVTLTVLAPPGTRSLAAAGPWNGFSPTETPLVASVEPRPEGPIFSATLSLPPGPQPYRLVIDGRPEAAPPAASRDPATGALQATLTQWLDGTEYRSLRVPDCLGPRLRFATLTVEPPAGQGAGGAVSGTVCAVGGEAALALETLTVSVGGVTPALSGAEPDATGPGEACFSFRHLAGLGKHSVRVRVADADGRIAELFAPAWIEARPFAWDEGLLYMVMVDRFRDSDGRAATVSGVSPIANHLGGDFGGLRAAIEAGELEALGATSLWLAPVLKNADGAWPSLSGTFALTAYHGYWPVSASAVDPRLAEASATSPEAALDAVVAAAHARGIRVIADVVLNHVHAEHPYCKDGQRPSMCRITCVCGAPGCGWDERPRDCQFSPYLPDLDHKDPATLDRILKDVRDFVIAHDIDGLRVDAVRHVERAALTHLRSYLADKSFFDDRLAPLIILGETFTGTDGRAEIAENVGPGVLDGQFDFPLYWSIRETFARGASFRDLEGALAASEAAYGVARRSMSPFAGNHDVERLATAMAGLDRGPFGDTPDPVAADAPEAEALVRSLSGALAFTLTLPGIPLLYAGDEVGLAGSGDPDNRRMFPRTLSTAQEALRARVRAIGQARRAAPVLARGARRELWMDQDLYVQLRWWEAGEVAVGPRAALVAIHRGGSSRTVDLTLPEGAREALEGARFEGISGLAGSGGPVTVRAGRASLTVGAGEVRILAP